MSKIRPTPTQTKAEIPAARTFPPQEVMAEREAEIREQFRWDVVGEEDEDIAALLEMLDAMRAGAYR